MKWFEEYREITSGADSELPASSPGQIAKIADESLDDEAMVKFMRDFYFTQKLFGEFIGVGESTVAGWVKSRSFPDYAKRATIAAYYAGEYFQELRVAKRDNDRPKVIKDNDRYLIVRFKTDETGVSIGEVLARDIPTEKAALVFAGSLRAWELLREAEQLIDDEIETREPEDGEWLQDLKHQIGIERTRAFAHEKLVEIKRQEQENFTDIDVDLKLFPEEPASDSDSEEEKDA